MTMNSESNSTYFEERILSATPLELIQILYDAALDRVRSARRHLNSGDAMARSHDVSKALEIFCELILSLSDREAKDSAATYSAIYRHLQKQLTEAHSQPSDSIFAEVEDTLAAMAHNWRGVKDLVQKSAPEPAERHEQLLADVPGLEMMYTAEATVEPANGDPGRSGRCWNL